MTRLRPTPADRLTLARLLSLPLLWAFALQGWTEALGIGLAVAGLTDVLDGPVARRTGKSSRWGSQLDSIADILLMASIFWWLVFLKPDFFRVNAVPLIVWAVVGTAAVATTLFRFGRMGDLHLYSAKTAGVLGYLFVVWLFVMGDYHPWFFLATISVAILASTETLLVAMTRDRLSEKTGWFRGRTR